MPSSSPPPTTSTETNIFTFHTPTSSCPRGAIPLDTCPLNLPFPSLSKCISLIQLILKNPPLVPISPFKFNLQYSTTCWPTPKCPHQHHKFSSSKTKLSVSIFKRSWSSVSHPSEWHYLVAQVRNLESSFIPSSPAHASYPTTQHGFLFKMWSEDIPLQCPLMLA